MDNIIFLIKIKHLKSFSESVRQTSTKVFCWVTQHSSCYDLYCFPKLHIDVDGELQKYSPNCFLGEKIVSWLMFKIEAWTCPKNDGSPRSICQSVCLSIGWYKWFMLDHKHITSIGLRIQRRSCCPCSLILEDSYK